MGLEFSQLRYENLQVLVVDFLTGPAVKIAEIFGTLLFGYGTECLVQSLEGLLLQPILLGIFLTVHEKSDENLFCFLLSLNHNYIAGWGLNSYGHSEHLGRFQDLPQHKLVFEIWPNVIHLLHLFYLLNQVLHVFHVLHRGISLERTDRVTVLRVHPIAKGSTVEIDYSSQVSPKEIQVFNVLIDVFIFDFKCCAVFLCEPVCNFVIRVEIFHNNLRIALDGCRP